MALKHHLGIAKTQVERLQFASTSRAIYILQLVNQSQSGTHSIVVVTISSQHDDEVGTSVDILPKVLSRRILDSNDATEVLNALVHLSHLEIGHTTIAVSTYRREFANSGQAVGNIKEMLEVASKSGSKSNAVAVGTHHLSGNVALCIAPFPATSREYNKCNDGHYTCYISVHDCPLFKKNGTPLSP